MSHAASTHFTYATAHGPLSICATPRGICRIEFGDVALDGERRATEAMNDAATQIQQYLAGKRRAFDLPVDLQGSAFQEAVWTAVCDIPYGETRTAADIAAALGKPGAHRSVGTAVKSNRLAPVVPTHRIRAAQATGKQAKIFRALVALEARAVKAGS